MDIKVNNLGYNFDNDGNTTGVSVGFSGNEDSSFLTSTVALTQADLADGATFDDLTKKQLTEIARTKLQSFTKLEQEEQKKKASKK